MFEQVEALFPEVAVAADQIERDRALPTELVARLKAAGAFRLLIPQQFGGLQARFEDYVPCIQRLAQADASTAWCVNQAAVIGTTSLWLPVAKITEIWAAPDTAVANGPPFDCQIKPRGEGFALTGHWGFSSGSAHASVVLCSSC